MRCTLLSFACLFAACTAPGSTSNAEGEGDRAEGEGEANEGEGDGGEGEGADECDSTDGLAIYERRIEPLVSGAVPTTCNQCHLEGVDLALYVQDTPCQTMACMINQGEVTLDAPSRPHLEQRSGLEPH